MVVELISVGTEILLGNIVNTNAAYLAEKCALLGCSLYHQTVVGDNEERMEEAIRQAIERADIVILTGGLGPTKDDLTKEVTAKVFSRKLYMDEHSKARIQDYFEKIKSKKVTENNWKQALVPEGAIVIDNLNGTAPGLILEDKERGKAAILIPGPPNEMKPMFEHDIAPYLNKKAAGGNLFPYGKSVRDWGKQGRDHGCGSDGCTDQSDACALCKDRRGTFSCDCKSML